MSRPTPPTTHAKFSFITSCTQCREPMQFSPLGFRFRRDEKRGRETGLGHREMNISFLGCVNFALFAKSGQILPTSHRTIQDSKNSHRCSIWCPPSRLEAIFAPVMMDLEGGPFLGLVTPEDQENSNFVFVPTQSLRSE